MSQRTAATAQSPHLQVVRWRTHQGFVLSHEHAAIRSLPRAYMGEDRDGEDSGVDTQQWWSWFGRQAGGALISSACLVLFTISAPGGCTIAAKVPLFPSPTNTGARNTRVFGEHCRTLRENGGWDTRCGRHYRYSPQTHFNCQTRHCQTSYYP